MGRAVAAIVSTVIGLVLLLSFKAHVGNAGTTALTSQHQRAHTTTKASRAPKAKPSATATKKASATKRQVTGDTADTNYGPVQVQVTLTGSHIDDVTAIQLPQQSQRDIQIDNYAVPQLRQEAIDAQSANINSVSGATFTSDGYVRSLQSALDKAGV
ncbi:MAG: FMN-binding protein [Actinomycetes bacterium]